MTSPWQKPVRGLQLDKTHPLAKGLIGCWVMNEATGDVVFDLSGNGNNGTINSADWVANGLDFVASNTEYVSGNIEIDCSTSDYSFVFGFHTDTVADSNKGILSVGDTPITSGPAILFQRDLAVLKYLTSGAGLGYLNVGTLTVGKEHTVAVTYDNIDHVGYLDGEHAYTTSGPSTTIISHGLYVGSGYNGYHDGGFLYIYTYNRALSAEEVVWLNREPYAMFQLPTNPALLYYETPSGVVIPIFNHLYNQMRS